MAATSLHQPVVLTPSADVSTSSNRFELMAHCRTELWKCNGFLHKHDVR